MVRVSADPTSESYDRACHAAFVVESYLLSAVVQASRTKGVGIAFCEVEFLAAVPLDIGSGLKLLSQFIVFVS